MRPAPRKPMDHNEYCWMNAAYVMGTRLTDAFAQYGFCTAIRGAEGGGKVENLPTHVFTSDDGDLDAKCPTEIGITDRREFELSNLGFLPLCHYKNTDYAVFFGAQTAQKPKKYDRPEATANAAISARLPYIMASSRFAHYLKVMARDKIGSFMEADDCERWLNRWIINYVNANENAGQETKARYPAAGGQGRGAGDPRQAGLVQRRRVSAAVAADGGTDHQPAHGRAHPGRRRADRPASARRQAGSTVNELRPRCRRPATIAADAAVRPSHRRDRRPVARRDAVRPLCRQPRPRAGGRSCRTSSRRTAARRSTRGSAPSAARRLRIDPHALRGALDRDIAAIDALLSEQLDAILHHARLRRLEGTWRGIAWLVDGTDQRTGSRSSCSTSAGRKSAATWNAPSSSTKASCSARSTRRSSARPAASRTACWWSTTRCATGPAPSRAPTMSRALAALSGVAAAAFCADHRRRLAGAAGSRQLRRSGQRHRHRRPAAQRGSCALAQPCRRARTCVSSVSPCRGCSRARHGKTTARAPMASATPSMRPTGDERVWMSAGYAFASVVARAFAQLRLAGRCARRRNRPGRRRPGRPTAAGAVPHRSRSASGHAPRSRSSGTTSRSGRCSMPG